ncbi:lysine--tRNA ligase [bacterium]|nr:lysine--tRNA ligase [bacterium]
MADTTTMNEDPTTAPADERAMRLAKRQALIDSGEEAYKRFFDQTDHAAELAQRYAGLAAGENTEDAVAVAGRVMAKRDQGKICFLVVRDGSGDIQVFARVNGLDEATWARVKDLDLGDIIGVRGTISRTRRGELSVMPQSVELLSKAVRPLPEKFHGLADKELRYRQRYVDLTMNPEVKDVFRKRFAIVSAIRHFMEGRGFVEAETPILQTIQGGATAKPFVTHFNALDQDCYLRIATELHLKRLLVGGFERVYELGRIFRNEGMDYKHNPEFTSIEAYQAYTNLEGMKELTQGLIQYANAQVNGTDVITYQGREINLGGTWPSRPMTELVSEVVGREVSLDTPVAELRELCAANGIQTQDDWGAGKLVFELYDELVEKTIVHPTFVVDYPVEVSPLAKRRLDDPRLTERFELVISGAEYANAFTELNDPVDQEARFKAQMEAKAHGDDEAMEYDKDYVRALEYGMPPAGGVGLGVDRLVMLLTDQASIRDVLLFPHMRPEAEE